LHCCAYRALGQGAQLQPRLRVRHQERPGCGEF
jgi:hypothetical protein